MAPLQAYTSVDIGVSELNSTPGGYSLQLGGTGSSYSDFTWQTILVNTMGDVNQNQVFSGCGSVTNTPTAAPSNTPEPSNTPTSVPSDTPEPTDTPTSVPSETQCQPRFPHPSQRTHLKHPQRPHHHTDTGIHRCPDRSSQQHTGTYTRRYGHAHTIPTAGSCHEWHRRSVLIDNSVDYPLCSPETGAAKVAVYCKASRTF